MTCHDMSRHASDKSYPELGSDAEKEAQEGSQ